jgi:hypothetical protein
MQYRFFWRKPCAQVSAEERIVRFRRILQSAQNVTQYRRSLLSAELDSSEAIRRVSNVQEVLSRLAVLPEKLTYRVDQERPKRKHEFQHPLALHSRTAVVAPDITVSGENRTFNWRQDARDLEAFRAGSMAAGVFTLREIASAIQADNLHIRTLQHALITFSGPRDGDLTRRDLDIFWRTFQVPIFEQRLGFDGMPIARECEVHDGLHVVEENAVIEEIAEELVITSLTDEHHPQLRVRSGYSGDLVHTPCACGRVSPRIKYLARTPQKPAAVAAAGGR